MYIAHRTNSGDTQPLVEHLRNTAKQSAAYAAAFGAEEIAYVIGVLHDLGKYLPAAQKRVGAQGARTDHATAGGKYIWELWRNPLALIVSYCIMSHHTGLINGGSQVDSKEEATLYSRLKKELTGYEICQNHAPTINLPKILPIMKSGFSVSFLIRMLFSCLVDADFIDTETFMSKHTIQRSCRCSMDRLCEQMEQYQNSKQYEKNVMNQKRDEILQECLVASEKDAGLFTLTVPTGGGKTISSLSFALNHARIHDMERIIYVTPYSSIIEQNSQVFADILGGEYVLAHYATAKYDNHEQTQKYLSCENWDSPVVVTTNVQFFESLFAKRTSSCRKLHNIANSVIIFDEAQMLPTNFLLPCISAISELVQNYSCTAVLCTATQSSLDKLFFENLSCVEICNEPQELYEYFRRVTYQDVGQLTDEELAGQLNQRNQVLCIVNNKRHARNLFMMLNGEGNYHLSTSMYAQHRKQTITEIVNRLKQGLPCRVVSTSLIEAGVDVDFPVVFRAQAGLDSIIQAGGRCNREGKRSREQSMVYVFNPEYCYRSPPEIEQAVSVTRLVSNQFTDIASLEAIDAYFKQLFYIKGKEALDSKQIISRLEKGCKKGLSFPFADIAQDFRLITDDTVSVFVPDSNDACCLLNRLQQGERNRSLLRRYGTYCVTISKSEFVALQKLGAIEELDEEISYLIDLRSYDNDTGLYLSKALGDMHGCDKKDRRVC